MKLQGRVAIITGGSSGIGLGCANVFARHGASVVIAALNDADLVACAGYLPDALCVACDVTREQDVRGVIEAAVARFGRLDCVLNNAGWHPPATSIDEIGVDDFERLLRLNLTGTFMGCKFAAPHLRKTKGNIINMSSEVALIGQDAAASYVSSKAGQLGLTRALALELAPAGVRVNAVCPAGVMTPLMRQWADTQYDPAAALKTVDGWHPLGRMATPQEIGEVCAFLASDEASFLTGQVICPDGGAMLGYRR